MDVMSNLEIEYYDGIIDIEPNIGKFILKAVLTKEVKAWLNENSIVCDFKFKWDALGHAELTFENEQDKLAFVLRWC